MRKLLLIPFIGLLGFFSCKKETSFTKDHLDFSKDTVLFDTIFTTIGSTTKQLKIYNRNNQPIKIDAIELMGGSASPFRINVDGISGDYHENIEIPAHDSLFVFVEVTLDVNGQNYPLVISDSLRFSTNGLDQYVYLDVWGQDAYFHVNEIVDGVWNNDKPHVIYGLAAVGYPGIDSNLNLQINAGTQIYGHKGATLLVYKSSLDIQGALDNEVVFQGDRLESFYDDVAGQWRGIWLVEANTSTINYAIIKNGEVGLEVDTTASAVTLNLTNTIIDNHAFISLFLNSGPIVNATNCFFGDAGLIGTYLFAGGEYHFLNCDFVNYWNGSRGGAALTILNHYKVKGTTYCRPINNSDFINNVVYGTIEKEFEMDTIDCSVSINFINNYLKRDEPYSSAAYINTIWDSNPYFYDVGNRDFHLVNGSPLIDWGDGAYNPGTDIENTVRDTNPDLGCYEYIH